MSATPGPWAFAKYSKKRFGVGQRGKGAFFLMQCVHDDTDSPAAIADARLISSAPELLESLKGLLAGEEAACSFEDYAAASERARALIARLS